MKKALITGITGQDGSYLAELLLKSGYMVYGIIRRASTFNTKRVDHIYLDHHDASAKMFLYYGDLSLSGQITDLVYSIKPDEIYHLAAQSHVKVSFDMPEYTGDITGLGTTRILDAIKKSGLRTKFYQASSSELFGDSPSPQNEETPFRPRSPYAIAKLYAYWMTRNYREGYDIYSCNGILFNHESPRRGETFVTRKITRAVAHILAKKQDKLYLGNLDAKRDWGFAPEYVECMWKMLQNGKACDCVIGSGKSYSVREFLDETFKYAGLDPDDYVEIDSQYFRPTEVEHLVADISKAKKEFNWNPKIQFEDLVKIMVDADMREIGLEPFGEGDEILERKFPDRWWIGD